MKRVDLVLIFLLLALFGIVVSAIYRKYSSVLEESESLKVQLASMSVIPSVRYIHDTIPVFIDKVVEVDRTDYKKMLADRKLIEELGLRIKQVESENRMLLRNQDSVLMVLRDSIYTFSDRWATFSLNTRSNVMEYSVCDSLSTIVSREYKHRFLWFRWGTKGYNVHIVSHNPRSRVEYSRFIKVR